MQQNHLAEETHESIDRSRPRQQPVCGPAGIPLRRRTGSAATSWSAATSTPTTRRSTPIQPTRCWHSRPESRSAANPRAPPKSFTVLHNSCSNPSGCKRSRRPPKVSVVNANPDAQVAPPDLPPAIAQLSPPHVQAEAIQKTRVPPTRLIAPPSNPLPIVNTPTPPVVPVQVVPLK
jgi:hypothetical protein